MKQIVIMQEKAWMSVEVLVIWFLILFVVKVIEFWLLKNDKIKKPLRFMSYFVFCTAVLSVQAIFYSEAIA